MFSGWMSKLLGLLLVVGALLATYFSIKQRGKLEEREKWQEATTRAKEALHEKVEVAKSKDAEIDAATTAKKAAIKEANKLPEEDADAKIFKF